MRLLSGDQLSLWRMGKLWVSKLGNPWTDRRKIWSGWICQRYHWACGSDWANGWNITHVVFNFVATQNFEHALGEDHTQPVFHAVWFVERQSQDIAFLEWYKMLGYGQVTARCVLSVVILPITTQQCRTYLYDKSWPNRWYEVGGLVGGNVS